MFESKKDKNDPNNYMTDGKMPLSEETKEENNVMSEKKKRWKIILIVLYIPLLGVLQALFWIGIKYKVISINDDMLKTIFNAIFLLLAFATNTRFNTVNLRDSKSLTNFRKSHYWLIIEYSSFMNVASLSICAFISIIELLTIKHSTIVLSIIVTIFILALIYSVISFLAGRHAGKYQ